MYTPNDQHEPLIALGDRLPRANESTKPKPLTAVNAKEGIYAGPDGKWLTLRPQTGPRCAPPPIREVIAEKRQQVEQAIGRHVHEWFRFGEGVPKNAMFGTRSGAAEREAREALQNRDAAMFRAAAERRKRSRDDRIGAGVWMDEIAKAAWRALKPNPGMV